jgi:hypothetical protein
METEGLSSPTHIITAEILKIKYFYRSFIAFALSIYFTQGVQRAGWLDIDSHGS